MDTAPACTPARAFCSAAVSVPPNGIISRWVGTRNPCRLLERIANRGRADDRTVHHLDSRAFAHIDRHGRFALGQVTCVRHIDCNGNIRFHRERRRARAAQANLLLRGKRKIQVVFDFLLGQTLHHEQQGHAADAIIQVRTAQHAVLFKARRVEHREVADLHLSLCIRPIRRTNINEEVVHVISLNGVFSS